MKYFRSRLTEKGYKLRLPEKHFDDISKLVLQQQKSTDPEQSPFRIQLSLWAFGIAVARAQGLKPVEKLPTGSKSFVSTDRFDMPEDLSDLLAVISLSELETDLSKYEHGEPREIIDLANRLAFVGVPVVLEAITGGDIQRTTLDKALEFAEETASQVG